jgi:hypothetical protein
MSNAVNRCARPACGFTAMPKMTATGTLETSDFCSDACERYTVWAALLVDAESNDETERQLLKLYHTGALLSLRLHPGEYDEPLENVDQTAVNDGG